MALTIFRTVFLVPHIYENNTKEKKNALFYLKIYAIIKSKLPLIYVKVNQSQFNLLTRHIYAQ